MARCLTIFSGFALLSANPGLHGPTSAAAITAAVTVMLAVAVGAGLLPALRAARLDPLVALRRERTAGGLAGLSGQGAGASGFEPLAGTFWHRARAITGWVGRGTLPRSGCLTPRSGPR